jgi:N-acetylmuramoyl-L-alanine amidase
MEQQNRMIINRTFTFLGNCYWILLFFAVVVLFPQPLLSQTPSRKSFTVVIDAGHGGKDPGAVGKKSYEKNIALAIAKKVGLYIESSMPTVNVIYTRKTDVFVDLYVRADIANKANADLFMSIHVDGFGSSNAWGTSTYVMGATKNQSNLALVMKENKVIELEEDYQEKYEGFDPNDPASYIKFSLMQSAYQIQSLDFASRVQDEFRERAKRRDRGVHPGPLVVLSRTTMPSVLIETGFITNQNEENFLNTEYGQDLVASSIFRAFRNYHEDTEKRTATSTPVNNQDVVSSVVDKPTEIVAKEVVPTKESPEKANVDQLVEFRVQVLASKTRIPPGSSALKGQTDLIEFKEGEYYKYLSKPTGNFADCQKLRSLLAKSFSGAFIVAFQNGNKIPLEKARQMEGR